MVVIGRIGAFFCAKAAADAAAGVVKRSAHRCDELHAALMASCTCEAAVWSAVAAARARDRALFAAAVDAIRERQLLLRALLAVASCWLKLASGCKTLASKPHRASAVGVSEDLSLAANGSL